MISSFQRAKGLAAKAWIESGCGGRQSIADKRLGVKEESVSAARDPKEARMAGKPSAEEWAEYLALYKELSERLAREPWFGEGWETRSASRLPRRRS
jgi:hypothetical protein